jgi:hypothetical protein
LHSLDANSLALFFKNEIICEMLLKVYMYGDGECEGGDWKKEKEHVKEKSLRKIQYYDRYLPTMR